MMNVARTVGILSIGLSASTLLAQQPFDPTRLLQTPQPQQAQPQQAQPQQVQPQQVQPQQVQPQQVQPQPQIIHPAPSSPGAGVPAAFPSARPIGGVPAAGGVPTNSPQIHQIPIVQTPNPAQSGNQSGASTPQAPAPNDGSAGIARLRRYRDDGTHYFRGYYSNGYGYGYYGPSYYYDPYSVVGTQQNFIVDPRLAAAAQPAPAAQPVQTRPATPLEIGEYALRMGDETEAIKQFKIHLKKNPDDAAAERMMALALLDDRKVDKAVAVLLHAYTKQPSLARDPIDPRSLSGYDMEHHDRFNRVMAYANRTKLSSALLAASVLAQSEERYDVSKKLLDRAIAEGLDKKVGDEMTMALTNR